MHLSTALGDLEVIEINLRPGRLVKPRALVNTPVRLSNAGADWLAEQRTQGIEDVVDITDRRQTEGGSQLIVVFNLNPDIAGAEELATKQLNRYLDHVRAELIAMSSAPQPIEHDTSTPPSDDEEFVHPALARLVDTDLRPSVNPLDCLALSSAECAPGILGQEYGDHSYD